MTKITITGADDLEMNKKFDHRNARNERVQLEIQGEISSVSDGYHTFEELYDHRITLFIALCKMKQQFRYPMVKVEAYSRKDPIPMPPEPELIVWRSKKHSDGEICFGDGKWFVMGIGKDQGTQITYHLPIERWEETEFAETLELAPEWDGHTGPEVIERLKQL